MAANSTLTKIIAEAKRIRKAHPKMYAKWTDYVKAASKKIKPGKTTRTKKAAKKKPLKGWTVKEQGETKAPTKKKLIIREPNGTFRHFKSINGLISEGKNMMIEKLGHLEAKKYAAKKAVDKRKIAKEIAEVKKHLRRFI